MGYSFSLHLSAGPTYIDYIFHVWSSFLSISNINHLRDVAIPQLLFPIQVPTLKSAKLYAGE